MELLPLLFAVTIVAFVIWIYVVLPYEMAEYRGRSGMLWVLIGLVGSPVLAILLLFALGDARPEPDESYE